MNEQNTELHYAKNIAKQRKTQRNIFIGLFSFMTILFIISTTALGLACKDGRQKLSFFFKTRPYSSLGGGNYMRI